MPLIPRYLDPDKGQVYRVLNDLVTFKAVATQTGGAYTLVEARTAPGQGLPLHVQQYDDETFFVLAGTYQFQIGDRSVALGPGGYAFVPRTTPHAYTNAGEGPARLLILISPGGIHEQFFSEIGVPVNDPAAQPEPDQALDVTRIRMVGEKYGIEILS